MINQTEVDRPKRMTIRKSYVDVGDGQIHYHYIGSFNAQPPLVFLHMTSDSAHAYDLLMEQLDGKYPCIALDTPNYGESFRTAKHPSMQYISEVFLEALTNLGVETFHLFGHHTGASTAAEMAIQAPDRALSYISNGATFATPEEMKHYKTKLSVPNPISIKGTQLMVAWSRIKDNFPDSHHVQSAPNQAEVMHREVVDMLRAGPSWNWGYDAVFTYDLVAAMEKVKCPVYFVCGDEDPSFPLHQRATAAYPHHPSHVCPHAGAHYNETHADELAPYLVNFVEEINSRAN
ncbi:hypothetical protein RBB50_012511 [Rhinocladiella similis]